MKINVLGWYNHGNIGDESYKLSFPIIFPNHEFLFTDKLNGDEEIVILGGGNVLSDHFLSIFNKLTCKKFCMSVGVTEHRKINCEKIYVRDTNSLKYLPNSVYMPDFAFALSPNIENGKKLLKTIFKNNELWKKVIVCVPNAHLVDTLNSLSRDNISYQNFCYNFSKFVDETPASFVFMPFGKQMPWDDRVVCGNIASKCKFWKKNVVLFDQISIQESLDIIAASNLVISQRLHASIFSCLSSIPFIDISHHDKNKAFLKTIKKEDVMVDYWDFSKEKLKYLTNYIFENYEKEQLIIDNISKEQQAILKGMSYDICLC